MKHLQTIDYTKVNTIRWFRECQNMGIPADQSSLMAMYIRNFEVNLDKHANSSELPLKDVVDIMNRST